MSTAPLTLLSSEEIESGICHFFNDFDSTLKKSNPATFRHIWEQYVGPTELLDILVAISERKKNIENPINNVTANFLISVTETTPINDIITNAMSNFTISYEPNIATNDNTLPAMYLTPSSSSTAIPHFVSLYISKSKILDYNDPVATGVTLPAFFQPAAPVAIADMERCLKGLDLRANLPKDHFSFAYVFSYPWSNGMSVIHNDNPMLFHENGSPYREKRKVGWSNLMLDLAAAAAQGNRVWRMKVLVLYGSVVDA